MSQLKAIGIDLGTTNSAVAWIDASGHTAMVPNAEGELLTPSVVLFEDAEVVVGKLARSATVLNPDRVAVWVKRDMGAPAYNRPIRGEYLPPEVIQACILRKLKTDVVHVLGPRCRCVITVPAYFDEARRKATADAGEMAGLQVLDIVNEPTAGALAFGEALGYLTPASAPKEELTVLVYDLGGGTFDVTLLRLSPGKIDTIATDGDVQLGGYDWDLRLVNHVAHAFLQTYGIDPREHPPTMGRLFNAVGEAKHTLSVRGQTTLRLDYCGRAIEVPVTRELFEDLTADLLERTAYTTRQLLEASKLQWRDVQRVLLVGGSTRMPAVQRMLQEMTGLTPSHAVNPDEAVARGAALYADYLLHKQAGTQQARFEVTNVNSHSLGIEGIDSDTLLKRNVILIPRNSRLPAKISRRFATKVDNQRSVVVQVLEGESSVPEDCTTIGRTVIRDLPEKLPRAWPVEVTFEYETNGRLRVQAVLPGVHREVKLDLERAVGLTNAGVARWKKAVDSPSGFNAFESALLEVLGVEGLELPAPPTSAGPTPAATGNPAFLMAPAAEPLAYPHAAGGYVSAPAVTPLPSYGPLPVVAPQPQPVLPQPVVAPPAGPSDAVHVLDRATLASFEPQTPASGKSRGKLRTVVSIVGFLVSAVVGLGAGYVLLHWWQPERFPWPVLFHNFW